MNDKPLVKKVAGSWFTWAPGQYDPFRPEWPVAGKWSSWDAAMTHARNIARGLTGRRTA